MDVQSLYNVGDTRVLSTQNTHMIKQLDEKGELSILGDGSENGNMFQNILNSAINSINVTNGYLSDAENEKIKLALGQTENTHDLTIALSKASTALQYTVAVRDRFLDAYKEIMQINV
ncbi:MAG: flagellar hook-basal body complex protein FliE [bacterium]|nr:flagellar hook-basal body complex protein FliE [Clostridium sp.]MCM1538776.1 flagellar hook-basal body complex protein FliE [bacterium]